VVDVVKGTQQRLAEVDSNTKRPWSSRPLSHMNISCVTPPIGMTSSAQSKILWAANSVCLGVADADWAGGCARIRCSSSCRQCRCDPSRHCLATAGGQSTRKSQPLSDDQGPVRTQGGVLPEVLGYPLHCTCIQLSRLPQCNYCLVLGDSS
jgi:hypothetical protein